MQSDFPAKAFSEMAELVTWFRDYLAFLQQASSLSDGGQIAFWLPRYLQTSYLSHLSDTEQTQEPPVTSYELVWRNWFPE